MLRDNVLLKVRENSGRIPVNISVRLAAFPEPAFQWSKDGQPLSGSRPVLTYDSVTFDNAMRSDAGNYTVVVTNYVLNSTTEQVGNDTGSFSLDVLCKSQLAVTILFLYLIILWKNNYVDGPMLIPGPLRHYVLLNESLTLVCGTSLESNPQATITWTAPDGTMIMASSRHSLENGPEVVRLNFTHTLPSDAGMWRCDIRTESDQYVVSDGSLVRMDPAMIGAPIQHNIELIIIGEYVTANN